MAETILVPLGPDRVRPATVGSARGLRGDRPLPRGDVDVYVGRAIPRRGWAASMWSNPFWNGKAGLGYDRRRVDHWWLDNQLLYGARHDPSPAVLYGLWLEAQPILLRRLPELAGKRLLCWCGTWAPGDPPIGCHAEMLARRVNGLFETQGEGEPPCLL